MKKSLKKHLLKHPCKEIGSFVNVEIDYDRNIIFRSFPTQSTLVNGNTITVPEEKALVLFKNEVYWLKKLKKKPYTPNLINIFYKKRLIVQEFLGDDLLIKLKQQTFRWSDSLSLQLLNIYKDLYSKNILKRNGSLSNMALKKNNQIVLFDFKWTCKASLKNKSINSFSLGNTCFDDEVYSIKRFLSKASKSMAEDIYNSFEGYFNKYSWGRFTSK